MPAGAGGPLEGRVRATYVFCTRVVSLLAAISTGRRVPGDAGPDWSAAREGFRAAAALYEPASDVLRAAVLGLPIDFKSPVEPLRRLPQDVEQLFSAADDLHGALARRFGLKTEVGGAPPSR